MAKSIYPRLAAQGLRKNRRMYLPYLLTCIVTAAMFYIILSLSTNERVASLPRGDLLQIALRLGCVVVGIFAVIFLFYTHSVILKQRKKEFGLFNILGMEKRHIGRLLALETLYIALLSLFFGLACGVLLDKLMYLLILRILRADYGFGFYFSFPAFFGTLALFGTIFLLTFLISALRVRLSHPIELLKGSDVGEREPKAKKWMTLLGILSLGIGYTIALSVENGVEAVVLFFVAVLFVILGTYLLFIAGSIALLKSLRKNKKFYYRTNHFTGISGMLYRMKQNGVGLASICILSTMVLVTVSTTTSFMLGQDDTMRAMYPYDLKAEGHFYISHGEEYADPNADWAASGQFYESINAWLKEEKLEPTRLLSFRYSTMMETPVSGGVGANADGLTSNSLPTVILPAEAYMALTGKKADVAPGEILLLEDRRRFPGETFSYYGEKLNIRKKADLSAVSEELSYISDHAAGGYVLVVSGEDALQHLLTLRARAIYEARGDDATHSYFRCLVAMDLPVGRERQLTLYNSLMGQVYQQGVSASVTSRASESEYYMSVYGGLFFLGLYLGTLFLMSAILIIYYKQISEGQEDKKRFAIMQKVGMSYGEVKSSIRSQILTVFFLPLITAAIHVAFAFPMIEKMLKAMGLLNTGMFALYTVGCFLIFAAIYVVVYLLTARVYSRIVRETPGQEEEA